MRAVWTALALVLALLFQSALSLVFPAAARLVDPFLLVLVYCGLTGGETHGMLAGAAAGWIQDVHFGGPVVGLSGLSKVVVGYGVGLSGTRFHLNEPSARVLVIFLASVTDAIVFDRLAAAFEVAALALPPSHVLARAAVNVFLGMAVFMLIERWSPPRMRP